MSQYIFKRTPLSVEDTDKLINAAITPQEKVIIYGLLETGMRVGEFQSLCNENFRWQEEKIIVDGKGGPFGSKSRKRMIPLSTRAKTIFEAHFTLTNGIPWSIRTIQRVVKSVAEKARIMAKVTPHVLRHTFACNCLRKSMSLKTIQRIMGHSNILVTEIYLNISDEDVAKEFREKW